MFITTPIPVFILFITFTVGLVKSFDHVGGGKDDEQMYAVYTGGGQVPLIIIIIIFK